MTRHAHKLSAVAALCALSGCGHSPQTHLLTLSMAPPAARPVPYGGPPVRITAVRIPAELDRLEFARAVSPTELQLQDQFRWSASLGSLAREALLRDLAARLPAGMVLPPDSPAAKGVRRVDVAVLALTTAPDHTTMDAMITVAIDGEPRVLRRQRSYMRQHATQQMPTATAGDYSLLLGELADDIAAMVTQMRPQG